ncbi:MAG: hypothetical protein IIZ19_00800 [Clostridia bacterium]|nr:hypothetical protein [Clostridia bacterium]MBQ1434426.1 hypothetical protein [Clostridia bacterium]
MKTRNISFGTVSVLLFFILLCSMTLSVYAAGESGTITAAEAETGTALAQVDYTASADALVIAALYDPDTGRMRAVGLSKADAGSSTVTVKLSDVRQDMDELRVFLLDRKTCSPLPESGTTAVDVGSFVTFGHYEQDNNTANGEEPIVWRVLAVDGSRALLISEKALDCRPYHKRWTRVTWQDCDLRTWLNHDFYDAAFDSEEKAAIAETVVIAEDNLATGTDAGSGTIDRVFLLSIGEVNLYFSPDSYEDKNGNGLWYKDRMCVPTAYAVSRGCWQSFYWTQNGEHTCCWWLRTPGIHQDYAAYVEYNGSFCDDGSNTGDDSIAVRPALWLELNP